MKAVEAVEWFTNLGNQVVTAEVMLVLGLDKPSASMVRHKYAQHTSRHLLPYIGVPGWVIQYPVFDDDGLVESWADCQTRPRLLRQLLRSDPGLYRALWSFPSQTLHDGYVYSDAQVSYDKALLDAPEPEAFMWDHSQLKALTQDVSIKGDLWSVEVLEEVTSDYGTKYTWVPVRQPSWGHSVAHRARLLKC